MINQSCFNHSCFQDITILYRLIFLTPCMKQCVWLFINIRLLISIIEYVLILIRNGKYFKISFFQIIHLSRSGHFRRLRHMIRLVILGDNLGGKITSSVSFYRFSRREPITDKKCYRAGNKQNQQATQPLLNAANIASQYKPCWIIHTEVVSHNWSEIHLNAGHGGALRDRRLPSPVRYISGSGDPTEAHSHTDPQTERSGQVNNMAVRKLSRPS